MLTSLNALFMTNVMYTLRIGLAEIHCSALCVQRICTGGPTRNGVCFVVAHRKYFSIDYGAKF